MSMNRFLAAGGILLFVGWAPVQGVPLPPEKKPISFLDLQPRANGKLNTNFHGGTAGNDLATLPQGVQKLGGVKFHIGAGLIQLAGQKTENKPDKVEGIPVGQAFATLHILHAAGTGYQTPDGTVIGQYTVHYQDRTRAAIPIVYGKDVRDWWYYANSPDVSRGQVAWKGVNAAAKKNNGKIRLYLTTWKNPQPRKKVVSIDFSSTKTTLAAPFCVAMTVQGR
jgi:hypothetical protein